MYFEMERIGKILDELKQLHQSSKIEIEQIEMKEIFAKDPIDADNSDVPWISFHKNGRWGGKDKYAWFRFTFTVPESLEGARLVYKVTTGKESGWDANNPQFLLFINRELRQGLDINHREALITESAKKGDLYTFDLQAYSGTIDTMSDCLNEIIKIETDIEQLYYDLLVPYEVCKVLAKDNIDRIDMIKHLINAINLIDFRSVESQMFRESIKKSLEYMNNEFYTRYCNETSVIAKCVGHTHIDVAWLWDLEQTRIKVQRSFATVLALMDQYDDYIFMSSQPQLYKFLKEDRPELYRKVIEQVKSGKWEPEGGMWVEADCNLSSGESLVRQIVLGKKFFREELGIESKILWLPDVFGYSAALPQIMKKTSIEYFMTTKISWNEYNKLPYDTFRWIGIDGSSVLSHFITTTHIDNLPERFMTTYNGFIDVPSVMGAWERYQQKDINNEVLISYGYGDGGGGPTKEMLEVAKRLNKGVKGAPKVELCTATTFFEQLDKRVVDNPKLPSWVGELYFEYHRGTLTSMARNKRYNRKSENLYTEAEWFSSMAQLIGGQRYPKELIDRGWEIICLNQFHDIIPGSSIKKVYDDSQIQYEEIMGTAREIINKSSDAVMRHINAKGKQIVVFNPLSFKRRELIEIQSKKIYSIYDGEMLIETEYRNGKISFWGDIPEKGYKSFRMVEEDSIDQTSKITVSVSTSKMENKFYTIRLDKNGNIESLYDKRTKREVIKAGQKANVLQAFEDRPHNWDAWDINIYYQEKMWEVNEVESIEVDCQTNHKGAVKINYRFMNSTISQIITLYDESPRIDIDTVIDWKEKHILLKAAFPVDVHTNKATYDIQFGNVERPTHWNTSWDVARFEVCGHKWADLSEDNYGVSLLNDCKYGYDIKDGVMRLTLLKSATSPNEDADRERHYFTYSLLPHVGNWKDGMTVHEAYKLNQPCYVFEKEYSETSVKGELPLELSFIKLNCDNVFVEVVKESEDGNSYVIRVNEQYNRRTEVQITLMRMIESVYETCMEERRIYSSIKAEDHNFSFEIKPYEVKTFKIILQEAGLS